MKRILLVVLLCLVCAASVFAEDELALSVEIDATYNDDSAAHALSIGREFMKRHQEARSANVSYKLLATGEWETTLYVAYAGMKPVEIADIISTELIRHSTACKVFVRVTTTGGSLTATTLDRFHSFTTTGETTITLDGTWISQDGVIHRLN